MEFVEASTAHARVSDNESVPVARYIIAQVRSLPAALSAGTEVSARVHSPSPRRQRRRRRKNARPPLARLRLEAFSQNRVRQLSRIPRPRHDPVPLPFLLYDGTTKTGGHACARRTPTRARAHTLVNVPFAPYMMGSARSAIAHLRVKVSLVVSALSDERRRADRGARGDEEESRVWRDPMSSGPPCFREFMRLFMPAAGWRTMGP